jgi:hypothetical protein
MIANDIIIIFMTIFAVILGIISYIPYANSYLQISVPSVSTLFLSIIILIITSKLLTLYAVLYWKMDSTSSQSTQSLFIWSFFISMLFGIFVYFNFAIGESERTTTLHQLDNNLLLAIILCIGILFFYSYCAIYAFTNQSKDTSPANQLILKQIGIISSVDLALFSLLWIRYWFS